jgi:hypothetical protein
MCGLTTSQYFPVTAGCLVHYASSIVVCLSVCTGEEQAKVEVLSDRLAELGQDVDALLATVAAREEGEAEGQEGTEDLL